MNREQRRRYAKELKKMGANQGEIKRYDDMLKTASNFAEGDKVTINYDKITSETGYELRTENYRTFVENNKDTIFTIEYDKKFKGSGNQILVTFAEDETKPKWLWYVDDLIKVDIK